MDLFDEVSVLTDSAATVATIFKTRQ